MPKETSEKKPAKEYGSASQSSVKARKKKHRIKLAILLSVILVASLAASVWYLYEHEVDQSPQVAENEELKYELVLEQVPYEDLQDRVEQFQFAGQVDEAEQLIRYQDYFKEDQQAHLLLASTFINSARNEEALQVFQDMEQEFGLGRAIAENIADQAAVINNNDLAREYYQKTIELIRQNPDENPLGDIYIEDIEAKIEELE